jgi:hypothetical protein
MDSAYDSEFELLTEDDSEGSLCDFIRDSDEDVEHMQESTVNAVNIVQTCVVTAGVRRSTRTRTAPVRYEDPEYKALMVADTSFEVVSATVPTTATDADDSSMSAEDSEEEFVPSEDGTESDMEYDEQTV